MSLGFRPTFAIELDCDSSATLQRLRTRLAEAPVVLRIAKVPGAPATDGVDATHQPASKERDQQHLTLSIPEAERHFWSPWLNLEVTPRGTGCTLSGRFSPHPSVWTGFMFAYLILSVLTFFALVFAAALSMSGGSPWTLALAGLCVAIMVLLWWSSQVGQRLAQDQMNSLEQMLHSAMHDCGCEPPTALSD